MQIKNDAWVFISEAVNAVSPEVRTVAQVKKKWFDIKVDAKKRLSEPKKNEGDWRRERTT